MDFKAVTVQSRTPWNLIRSRRQILGLNVFNTKLWKSLDFISKKVLHCPKNGTNSFLSGLKTPEFYCDAWRLQWRLVFLIKTPDLVHLNLRGPWNWNLSWAGLQVQSWFRWISDVCHCLSDDSSVTVCVWLWRETADKIFIVRTDESCHGSRKNLRGSSAIIPACSHHVGVQNASFLS